MPSSLQPPSQPPSPARRFRPSVPVMVAAALLVVSAFGLHPALDAASEHFTKLTIDINRPLAELDVSRLPSFEQTFSARTIGWTEQDIGTDEAVSLMFVSRRHNDSEGRPIEAMLHMAYYSDPRSQVSHTPEVCFRQDGGVIGMIRTVNLDVPELAPKRVQARLVPIQRPGEPEFIDVYLFVSNGRFYHDRERLRLAIGWPGDRYTYFCKVETGVVASPRVSVELAETVAKELLAEVLPILLEDHLPTREQVRR